MKNKIRYVIGIICIIGSFGGMSTGQPLPSIFMMIFGVSLLPIIYEKTDLRKIKNIELILPIITFIIFAILISIFGNTNLNTNINNKVDSNNIVENNPNSNNENAEENNESVDNGQQIERNKTQDNTSQITSNNVLDVLDFNNINYSDLINKMGNPSDTDTYKVDGKTAQIYIYDEKYEFMFYNDKLIRVTICAYNFDELKNLNKISDFCEKLNITSYSTNNKTADTGYALRYKDFTNTIKDFWITGLQDSEYIQIKITFDLNGFNI